MFRYSAIVLTVSLLAASCSHTPPRPETAPTAVQPGDESLYATLWMQHSLEYQAITTEAFRQACAALDKLAADTGGTALVAGEQGLGFESLPPAVIADIDETLLDNSAYQARRIHAGSGFTPESWLEWTRAVAARPIPGALDFARCVQSHGATLVYISNRDFATDFDSTVKNLRQTGFPLPENAADAVLLRADPRGPGREKGARRRWVAQRFRVVQLLGDNLGDFIDGIDATTAARQTLVEPYRDRWGERWIMLPNPMYGSWETALRKDCGEEQTDALACKRSLLRTK